MFFGTQCIFGKLTRQNLHTFPAINSVSIASSSVVVSQQVSNHSWFHSGQFCFWCFRGLQKSFSHFRSVRHITLYTDWVITWLLQYQLL